MEQINCKDFEKVELGAGTIIEVGYFPEAHTATYKLKIDFWRAGSKAIERTDQRSLQQTRAARKADRGSGQLPSKATFLFRGAHHRLFTYPAER